MKQPIVLLGDSIAARSATGARLVAEGEVDHLVPAPRVGREAAVVAGEIDARMSWLVSRGRGLTGKLTSTLELLHACVLGRPYSLLNGRAYDLTQDFVNGTTPPRSLR